MSTGEVIKIEFAVEGVQALRQVFDSLEQRMIRFDRAASQSTERASRGRVTTTRREVDEREKAFAKLAREPEKWEKAAAKEAANAAAAKERGEQQLARRTEQIRENSFRMAQRLREREVAEERRAASQRVAEAEAEERRVASVRKQYRSRLVGAAGSGLGSFASRGIGMATAGAVLGGGFLVADAFRSDLSNERAAAGLSTSAYNPYGEGANAFTKDRSDPRLSTKSILSRAGSVSIASGFDKGELIKGWQEYVKLSSDFAGGGDNLGEFAKLSKASGTDFQEVMKTAGTLRVQNKNLGADEMMNLLRGVIGQGKMGAIEFTDLAKYAGVATSTSGSYAGPQADNQRKLLGLMQISRRTTNDAAESATVVSRLSGDFGSNSDKILAGTGLNVKNANHELLDPAEIVGKILQKVGGDTGKLKDIGILRESKKFFDAVLPTYRDAGGGEAGAKAVEAEMRRYEGAGYSKQDVDADNSAIMSTTTERLNAAMLKIADVAQEKAAPFLEKFATSLEKHEPDVEHFLGALSDVANFLLEHPWRAIFTLMGLEVSASIAKAAIGESVKNALGVGIGQGATAGMPIAMASIGVAVAAAISGGIAAIDMHFKELERDQNAQATAVGQSGVLIGKLKSGKATPEEVEQAKKIQAQLQAGVDSNKADTQTYGSVRGFVNSMSYHFGSGEMYQVSAQALKMYEDSLKEVSDALKAQAAKVRSADPAAAGGAPAPAGGQGSSAPHPSRSAPHSHPSRGGVTH